MEILDSNGRDQAEGRPSATDAAGPVVRTEDGDELLFPAGGGLVGEVGPSIREVDRGGEGRWI